MKWVEKAPNHWMPDQTCDEVKEMAQTMWWYSEPFSPKAVPKFYDVSGITENPKAFKDMIQLFVQRYKAAPEGTGPTHIIGYDARGFIIGPPIAMELGIPFVLLRKSGKNPGVLVESSGYNKEYAEKEPETQCIRLGSIDESSRVVLIDDLIATGGTAISGFELVGAVGAKVYEFASVIELPFLEGVKKIREFQGGKFKDVSICTIVDDSTIPDSACGDPKDWKESNRTVPAETAKAIRAKYDFPR